MYLIMPTDKRTEDFLSAYSPEVISMAMKLRGLLLDMLPDVTEQVDLPAKIIGYGYGNKYSETICVIIPSKKGIKLGFYKGNELPDPDGLLEGTGKISRYVNFTGPDKLKLPALKRLIKEAYTAYKHRMDDMKSK